MNRMLKILFFGLVVRPIVLLALGLNIGNRVKLPRGGPAVIAANHNSHLDTMVLMSLYPLKMVHLIRPVAAEEYFMKNKALAWFSLNVIGVIPLSRMFSKDVDQLFAGCRSALDAGDILIIFPEGSRGQPGKITKLKRGLCYLLQGRKDTLVTPVVMHGLGKALPKGEALLVPFNCDVIIGDSIAVSDDSKGFMNNLSEVFENLAQQCLTGSHYEN
ncbi:MAG: lysophospholipid acyltransferase family protein [Rubritalea sp.]|uniref:lysophospholipid acyltransferase family protein n=1 Tax=Rubritalea sp. TaxID=2109375 RepID=UPI00324218FB